MAGQSNPTARIRTQLESKHGGRYRVYSSGLAKHANTTALAPETVYHTHMRIQPHNFLRYMSGNLHVFGTDGNIVAVFEDVRYEAIVQKTLHSESTLHDRVDETAHTANHKLSLTELLN